MTKMQVRKARKPKYGVNYYASVTSESGHKLYTVIKRGSTWNCTCPDHIFRARVCKHIIEAKKKR